MNIKNLLINTVSTIIFTLLCSQAVASTTKIQTYLQKKFAEFETIYPGRLGISAIDTSNNNHIEYRANERFPFCSTAKFIAVAAILKNSMSEKDMLNKSIVYQSSDLVDYSPITEKYANKGMTIFAISDAAMTVSDNTAMNLLINKLGGPTEITRFARSIGDMQFRLDRMEPELNTSIPGDKRDTTTPAAMNKSLKKLVLGDILGVSQREQLLLWLKNNTTGNLRIRAGVPNTWIVGDKTGGGNYYGTTNDIGIIFPLSCKPIVLAIYFTQNKIDAKRQDQVIANVTRLVIDEFAKTNSCLKNAIANKHPMPVRA